VNTDTKALCELLTSVRESVELARYNCSWPGKVRHETRLQDIDAMLARLERGDVVVVPGEATEHMDDAAHAAAYLPYEKRGPIFKAVYKAMLSAAQEKSGG
jgi:hypothetical protein